jgi:hypothetical protein
MKYSCRRERYKEFGVYIGLSICFSILALFICWSLFPYKTMTVNNVSVVDKTVEQGGVLSVFLDYTRYTDVNTTITRDFVDGLIFTTGPEERKSEAGTFRRFIEVPIPTTLPPGVYTMRTNVEFHINPIRDINQSFSTGTFIVTDRNHDESLEKLP